MGLKGDKMHPNSLKNLKPMWDKESANAAREKGLEVRRANKQAREELKMSMAEWKKYKSDVLAESDMSSIDILKILMMKALQDDDFDTAADLAKTLAEFEQPKLARVDQTVTDATEDLTDEELDERIKRLLEDD